MNEHFAGSSLHLTGATSMFNSTQHSEEPHLPPLWHRNRGVRGPEGLRQCLLPRSGSTRKSLIQLKQCHCAARKTHICFSLF